MAGSSEGPVGLGYLILGRPDGLFASGLSGIPRSPQLPAGLELCRHRAASPAGFGVFALLDGPGLTQFRVLGFRVQGFRV